MKDDLDRVLEKEKKRYSVLKAVYDLTNGSRLTATISSDLARATELSEEDVEEALDYLIDEGLVKNVGFGIGSSITHQGRTEVEQSIKTPNKPTDHFQVSVIQNFYQPVGAVQTGNQNTANITQNIGTDTAEVLQLIESLRQNVESLPSEVRDEATEYLEDVQAEVTNPTKFSKRKSAMLAIWSTGKNVVPFANQALALADKLGIQLPL